VGLPGLEVDDEWFEPLGVASLLVEGVYLALYAYVLTQPISVMPAGLSRTSAQPR
jgi:hypothetical protein